MMIIATVDVPVTRRCERESATPTYEISVWRDALRSRGWLSQVFHNRCFGTLVVKAVKSQQRRRLGRADDDVRPDIPRPTNRFLERSAHQLRLTRGTGHLEARATDGSTEVSMTTQPLPDGVMLALEERHGPADNADFINSCLRQLTPA